MRAFLAVGLAMLLFSAAAASAADTPCWKRVIEDWYDGRFDRTYPCACYREALRRLPASTDTYSTAKQDIERELHACQTRQEPKQERNIPAQVVAAVLAVVAVLLLIRRRRGKPPGERSPSA